MISNTQTPRDTNHAAFEILETNNHDATQKAEADRRSMDTLLAAEMNQMSLKERELVYEELHGVDEVIEETPSFINESLQELQRELQDISNKSAYNQAESMNPEYVQSQEFRLMFLRAERFDAKKAASRLVNFMEGKLEYFGPDSLARPIELTDLDADDMAFIKSGVMQFLPGRDVAGRAILCDSISMHPRSYKTPRNMVRTISPA